MKNILRITLILWLIVLSNEIFGQISNQPINFNMEAKYSKVIFGNDDNLFVIGGKGNTINKDEIEILRIGSDLSVKNRFQLKEKSALGGDYVVSSDASYLYHYEEKGNTQYVTQVDASGNLREFEFNRKDLDFKKHDVKVFSSSRYLYYISSDEFLWEIANNKDKIEYFLNYFDHQTFTHKQKKLDLPVTIDSKNTTLWKFLGFKGENLLVYNYYLQKKISKFKYTIVEFDPHGNLLNQKILEVPLKGKFVRASELESHDEVIHIGDQPPFDGKIVEGETIDTYSCLKFDNIKDEFYVFGLSGSKPKMRPCDNYYVIKFDGAGNEILRIQNQVPQKMVDDKMYYKKYMSGYMRKINLYQVPSSDNIRLIITGWENVYGLEFDKNGQQLDFFFEEYKNQELFYTRMNSNLPSKSAEKAYIKSKSDYKDKPLVYLPGENHSYLYWWSDTPEIVKF